MRHSSVALGDRYVIERELGAGGMATVYLAEDCKHRRKVAIKFLRPELGAALGADRFLREIEIAARLTHPHILAVHDSGESAGSLYYVMPYVEGESLRQRLDRERPLPLEEALRITREVADALAYAHRRGVVHRDIKPENILLEEGHAVVADFGIARAVSKAAESNFLQEDAEPLHSRLPTRTTETSTARALTETGVTLGTPAYMSPEQACGELALDGRSDIYSLACVLYEMLAGVPPFTGPNPQAVIAHHAVDMPPSLRRIRPFVPESLEEAVTKALAKIPELRFSTAAEFADVLIRAAPGVAEGRLKTILVLPFANLTGDPENEYFADGLTDELITCLSKVHSLRVISRTSAMRLKGTSKDLQQIAQDLNVRFILEGNVRRPGGGLRVAAQLVDASNETLLWSDKYEGTSKDVFQIQETLARTIVTALEITLSPEEQRRLSDHPVDNPLAYECYLRARKEVWTLDEGALGRAVKLIENALSIVGDDPLLYAAQAFAVAQHVWAGITVDPQYLTRANHYVDRAFALAPRSYHGLLARGLLLHNSGDFQGAVRDLKAVLAVDHNNPDCLLVLGYIYALVGRESLANELLSKLLQVDPLTPLSHCMPGFVAVLEGRPERALEPYRRNLEMEPNSPAAHWYYIWVLGWNNRISEAVAVADGLQAKAPHTVFASAGQLLKYAFLGDRVHTIQAATSELQAAAIGNEMFSREMAHGYALVGAADEALFYLENATRLGFANYPFLAHRDRFLDRIRPDPRVRHFLERVKEQWKAFET